MYEDARLMVDVEKVLPLFEGLCGKKSCQAKNEVVEQKLKAGVLTQLHNSPKIAIVTSGTHPKFLQPKVGRNCLFQQLFWQQQH